MPHALCDDVSVVHFYPFLGLGVDFEDGLYLP